MLIVLERECQEINEAIENVNEKQELLTTLMVGEMRPVLLLTHERGHTSQSRVTEST